MRHVLSEESGNHYEKIPIGFGHMHSVDAWYAVAPTGKLDVGIRKVRYAIVRWRC